MSDKRGTAQQLGPGVVKIGMTFLITSTFVVLALIAVFAFRPDAMKDTTELVESFMDMASELAKLFMAGIFGVAGGAGAVAWGSRTNHSPVTGQSQTPQLPEKGSKDG